ncbi:MAG: hypothetical protein LBH11_04375 [Propionibacteriaceae bacterium]|jgi:hypothetical protein|nr:hypothetical protein [Propionibacteriaceae bacterium]
MPEPEDRPVLVPSGPDAGLVWHCGSPFGEQRTMESGRGAVIIDRIEYVPHAAYPGPVAWVWLGRYGQQPPDDNGFRAEPGIAGGTEWLLPLEDAEELVALNTPVGLWAYEALRIAAGVPRADLDLPEEAAPPEGQLAVLLLEGDSERLPPVGSPVLAADVLVGRLGSSAQHHELGPIALALLTVPHEHTPTRHPVTPPPVTPPPVTPTPQPVIPAPPSVIPGLTRNPNTTPPVIPASEPESHTTRHSGTSIRHSGPDPEPQHTPTRHSGPDPESQHDDAKHIFQVGDFQATIWRRGSTV